MPSEFQRNLPAGAFVGSETPWLSRLRIDPVLLLLLLLIAGFGLFVLYSASGSDIGRIKRQMIYLLIGFTGLTVVAQFATKTLQALSPLAYGAGVLLLVAVLFAGIEVNGSTRWISLAGLFRFQPSELMKLATPLAVAAYLARVPSPPEIKHLGFALTFVVIPFLLVARQPDLGTSLLIGVSGLLVIWLAGLRWSIIIGFAVAAMAAAWPVWVYVLKGYQKQRILTLLDPESDRLGAGWNIIQSKTAIGSGGWTGKGWLNGTQSHLDFLPEGHTDFIIAVLAEEFGLLGIFVLLTLYMLIVIRCCQITLAANDRFSMLFAGSLTFTFFIYVLVNMGMVSGILPVVGVPLPLVSYGGTAMVTMIASFGFMMAVHAESRR